MTIIVTKGGKGSGNFEHVGVPGHVGGSAPTTGMKNRRPIVVTL